MSKETQTFKAYKDSVIQKRMEDLRFHFQQLDYCGKYPAPKDEHRPLFDSAQKLLNELDAYFNSN